MLILEGDDTLETKTLWSWVVITTQYPNGYFSFTAPLFVGVTGEDKSKQEGVFKRNYTNWQKSRRTVLKYSYSPLRFNHMLHFRIARSFRGPWNWVSTDRQKPLDNPTSKFDTVYLY
jgi:hypothetical protein